MSDGMVVFLWFLPFAVIYVVIMILVTKKKPTVNKPDTKVSPKSEPTEIKIPKTYDGFKLYKIYDDVDVCVIKGEEPDYGRLFLTGVVLVEQEPDNPYDDKAVVVLQCGRKLGYIYRGGLQDMINDFLDRGEPILARLVFVDAANDKLKIKLAFYK